MDYIVKKKFDDKKITEAINELNDSVWPDFMDGEKVMRTYWGFVEGTFPDYQLGIENDGELLAAVNSAPIQIKDPVKMLDSGGIYWALRKISHDYMKGNKCNALVALQVMVTSQHRGKRLSYICVRELLNLAKEMRLKFLVIPLRPSRKYQYPLINIDEYITWKNKKGLPFDPWLRVHIKLGGKILNPCAGPIVRAPKEKWAEWTKLDFCHSGQYVIPEGLDIINVTEENENLTYRQNNVWVIHQLE